MNRFMLQLLTFLLVTIINDAQDINVFFPDEGFSVQARALSCALITSSKLKELIKNSSEEVNGKNKNSNKNKIDESYLYISPFYSEHGEFTPLYTDRLLDDPQYLHPKYFGFDNLKHINGDENIYCYKNMVYGLSDADGGMKSQSYRYQNSSVIPKEMKSFLSYEEFKSIYITYYKNYNNNNNNNNHNNNNNNDNNNNNNNNNPRLCMVIRGCDGLKWGPLNPSKPNIYFQEIQKYYTHKFFGNHPLWTVHVRTGDRSSKVNMKLTLQKLLYVKKLAQEEENKGKIKPRIYIAIETLDLSIAQILIEEGFYIMHRNNYKQQLSQSKHEKHMIFFPYSRHDRFMIEYTFLYNADKTFMSAGAGTSLSWTIKIARAFKNNKLETIIFDGSQALPDLPQQYESLF